MRHLTEEQFEDALQGARFEHLGQCDSCRASLMERRATAVRLRQAFESVRPPAGLEAQLRATVLAGPLGRRGGGHGWQGKALWALAAGVMMALVPLGAYLGNRPTLREARASEIVAVHEVNVAGGPEFHSESDPAKLAGYFREVLGFVPAMPEPGRGLSLRGCCVAHFGGRQAGSYVVDTPDGVISVLVTRERPEDYAMQRAGDYWNKRVAHCNLAARRIGEYTYCAVGEMAYEQLEELLDQLLQAGEPARI